MNPLREVQRQLANQAKHKSLNAFISLAEPNAVLEALNGASQASGRAGPLRGKLIGIKDNICTADLPTTAASGILKTFKSPYDATVVQRLTSAGAIVAGKTNLDEFGMGSFSVNSVFGAVRQSEGEDGLSAGGSSGGSAVAVATDQCWAALGTDTGGSVRLPAAYTGVVGFKPSYGLLSRWGVIAYTNSLDTVGILSKTTAATRQVFECLNAYDSQDPTSLEPHTREAISRIISTSPVRTRLRIGVPTDYNITELQPSIREAWIRTLNLLVTQGHSIHPVSLPSTRHALSAYYVIAPAEASSNLAKYDGVRYGTRLKDPASNNDTFAPDATPDETLFARTRDHGFGDEVKRRILLGTYSLSAAAMDNYFIQAQKIRRLAQDDFNRAFRLPNPLLSDIAATEKTQPAEPEMIDGVDKGVDILICPTAPTTAPTLRDVANQRPVDAYMNDVFTVPANLAGLPAISIPVTSASGGYSQGDDAQGTENNNKTTTEQESSSSASSSSPPIGIQVIGQFGDDGLVLDVAQLIEELMAR